jgi:hypothetical protein
VPPTQPLAQKVFSWLALGLGVLIGFLAILASGLTRVPDPGDPYWLRPLFGLVGIGLLGLVFLIASAVALRSRRSAGLVFLIFAPPTAFCLTYAQAGFLVTHANGGVYFHSPILSVALGLWFLFYLPFLVTLLAIRNRRRAVYLFLISAAIAGVVFCMSQWTAALLPKLTAWSALFAVFAGFWLETSKLGWPALIAATERSRRRRLAAIVLGCFLVAILDVAATLALIPFQSLRLSPDCSGVKLFRQSMFPGHEVFTARLIRVGHTAKVSGRWAGDWAIGVVEDQFWGLPSWAPHIVFLTNNIFWEGGTYFIDGRRASGALTRLLPIVEAGPCARTRLVADATLDLRVLREGPPKSGVSIVGCARKPEESVGGLRPPPMHTPLGGASVSVTGSAGTTTVTTDQDGIYEVNGLPEDNYIVKIALPETQVAEDGKVNKKAMAQNRLFELDFYAAWNGTIEGRVTDSTGRPAHVWLMVRHSDGTDLGPYVRWFFDSGRDGSFRLERVPPGRYKLTVNPYGPSEDSPYAPFDYRFGRRGQDADVLEFAAGQHIKNLDFEVRTLPGRDLHTRVTWPDGKAAEGAWVYVAYQHTSAYEPLREATDFRTVGHDGFAELRVFGDSHVRIFAEAIVEDEKTVAGSPRYSAPVELDAVKLPDDLNLVISSSRLPQLPNR